MFLKADSPITLDMVRQAFRFHYDGTDHDPYLHSNPKEPFRPVSIFRTTQTHILQVRPDLPKEIGCITYFALGMADLSVFLPIYQGIKSFPHAYTVGTNVSSPDSAYWKMRKVQALGMVNYNLYAPIIKSTFAALEKENDERQREFEAEYMAVVKTRPLQGADMLQAFSDRILTRALEVADSLTERLFTEITINTQKEYLFHGA